MSVNRLPPVGRIRAVHLPSRCVPTLSDVATPDNVVTGHSDRQVDCRIRPRAAVGSRSFDCLCVDHSLRVKLPHRPLARAV